MAPARRILVTGFEPFGGADDNPSARIVEALSIAAMPDVIASVLPVSAAQMPRRLATLLEQHRPGVVLGLGEARGSAVLRIERVAANLLDFRIPDNDGHIATNVPVVAEGPSSYLATAPVDHLVEVICRAGVPCELSLSAGCYLCNQMMYLALHWAAETLRATGRARLLPSRRQEASEVPSGSERRRPTRDGSAGASPSLIQPRDQPVVGFLHLPSLPTQNTSASGCSTMDRRTLLRAVLAVIDAIRGAR